jgi:hypothetical protein
VHGRHYRVHLLPGNLYVVSTAVDRDVMAEYFLSI